MHIINGYANSFIKHHSDFSVKGKDKKIINQYYKNNNKSDDENNNLSLEKIFMIYYLRIIKALR